MTSDSGSNTDHSLGGEAPHYEDRLRWLGELFPEAVTEGAVDLEKLKEALGEFVDGPSERYSFTWAGRRAAQELLQLPSRGALEPLPDLSVDSTGAQHVFIEGDNLEVLKLLYRAYFGRIKVIYIDPPYNTGKDFVYSDNYTDPLDTYLQITGQKDAEGNLLTSNPETSGRFHSTWLSMMYPRIFMARQLLREDGVIFVSIDDHEVHNLRMMMNSIFGEENFIAQIVVQLNPRGRHLDRFTAKTHEYLMVYARDAEQQALYQLEKGEAMLKEYNKEDGLGRYRELGLRNRNPAFNRKTRPNLYYPLYVDPETGSIMLERAKDTDVEIYPLNSKGEESCWTWSRDKVVSDGHLLGAAQRKDGNWWIFRKDYILTENGETPTTLPKALWTDKEINNDYGKKALQELFGDTVYDFPKAPGLIEKILLIGTKQDDLVLDFFAGSGTTGQAVLELNQRDGGNRTFLLVELPEPLPEESKAFELGFPTSSSVGIERVRRVMERLQSDAAEELPLVEQPASPGLRVYRLTESNHKIWAGLETRDPEAYGEQMEFFNDTLRHDFDPISVVWEVALREGLPLTSVIDTTELEEVVYRVQDDLTERGFWISLDDKVEPAAIEQLGFEAEDLFICRDSALTDEAAANLALTCTLKTI